MEAESTEFCAGKEHAGHICELESRQEWDLIRQVTLHPTVRCENCGSLANCAGDVCMPTEIES